MVMKPFEIRIELKSPMQLGTHPVRLDGLVWHALFLHYGCATKAQKCLPEFLMLHESNTFLHASSLVFGTLGTVHDRVNNKTYIDNVIACSRTKVGIMREGSDLSPQNFSPNGKNGIKYKKIIQTGGVYKNRLDKYDAYFSRFLLFYGVGHGDKVADLIDFYVPAIGVNANNGCGTIGKTTSHSTSKDFSLIDQNGLPARPLPTQYFSPPEGAQIRRGAAILYPPFRHQPSVDCYLPERIKKLSI